MLTLTQHDPPLCIGYTKRPRLRCSDLDTLMLRNANMEPVHRCFGRKSTSAGTLQITPFRLHGRIWFPSSTSDEKTAIFQIQIWTPRCSGTPQSCRFIGLLEGRARRSVISFYRPQCTVNTLRNPAHRRWSLSSRCSVAGVPLAALSFKPR